MCFGSRSPVSAARCFCCFCRLSEVFSLGALGGARPGRESAFPKLSPEEELSPKVLKDSGKRRGCVEEFDSRIGPSKDYSPEKSMATHSSTLAWKIAWMEEPGRLQSLGLSWTRLSGFAFSFHFHALEKEMAIHSSTLAWKIAWMEEPDRLQSAGSQRVGHD